MQRKQWLIIEAATLLALLLITLAVVHFKEVEGIANGGEYSWTPKEKLLILYALGAAI